MTSFEIIEHIGNSIARDLRPGLSTNEIDAGVESFLKENRLESYFKGYNGYPGVVSISINEQVLGAIPSGRILEAGDLVKIETGVKSRNQCAYFGWTVAVGEPSERQQALLRSAELALDAGCAALREGSRTTDVTAAIDTSLRNVGLTPNKDFVGYRIGERPHMSPQIPCSMEGKRFGSVFEVGATYVVLVVAHVGSAACVVAGEGFTILSKDQSESVLLSRTITLAADGPHDRVQPPVSYK